LKRGRKKKNTSSIGPYIRNRNMKASFLGCGVRYRGGNGGKVKKKVSKTEGGKTSDELKKWIEKKD